MTTRTPAELPPPGRWCAPRDRNEPHWRIVFDDPDHKDLVFVGAGAEEAARRVFDERSRSWNCHLLSTVEVDPWRDSRTDPPDVPDGAPLANVGQTVLATAVDSKTGERFVCEAGVRMVAEAPDDFPYWTPLPEPRR